MNWRRLTQQAGYLIVIMAALAIAMPGVSSAADPTIGDILAPGIDKYPPDFKWPSKKCENDCRQYLTQLNLIRKDLEKYNTPEWKDWWKAGEAVKTKDAAFKPFQEALAAKQEAVTAANKAVSKASTDLGKAKKADKPAAQTALNDAKTAQTQAKKDFDELKKDQNKEGSPGKNAADEKKKADDNFKKADSKLPQGNKSSDIRTLRRLAEEARDALAKLEACLSACGADVPPPPPPPPGGPVAPIKLPVLPKCFNSEEDYNAFQKQLDDLRSDQIGKKRGDEVFIIGKKNSTDPAEIQLVKDAKERVEKYEANLKKINDLADEAEKLWKKDKKKCPGDGSMIFPGNPGYPGYPGYPVDGGQGHYVTFTGDGGKWCTYADGAGIPGPIAFADENGNPVVDGIPVALGTPPPPGTPTGDSVGTPPPPPGKTPDTPPPPGKTPEDPPGKTTEQIPPPPGKKPEDPPPPGKKPEDPPPPGKKPEDPPPGKTTEQIPPPPGKKPEEPVIPDTVFVKARESVLEEAARGAGKEIQGQTVKLLPPEKPDLPRQGESRTAQDKGFDKPPAQCTTAADGACKIDTAPDDREFFGMPTRAGVEKQNYRVDAFVRTTTGAVVETTKTPQSNFVERLPGVSVIGDQFSIGNRTFARVSARADAGAKFSLRSKVDKPGSNYEEDICRDKQPGPPLGMESAAIVIGDGLPATTIRLLKRHGGGKR